MSPYEVLKEDADETIALFNALVETTPEPEEEPLRQPVRQPKEKRIKVNDKTATGGWF